MAPSSPLSSRSRLLIYGAVATLSAASLALLKLAPFMLVGSFIAYLALPRERGRALTVLTSAAALLSLAGFMRFLVVEAMPGIVQGGNRATEDSAVSRLRQVLFAEDALRKRADVDPDHDGIGSAGLLSELAGYVGLRGGARLVPPLLERFPEPLDSPIGPVMELSGYLFVVCLPAKNGGFTARPGEIVDEEAAERRFVAYAWPAADQRGLLNSFFMDEHERILFAGNGAPAGKRPRIGLEHPPACDEALNPKTSEEWQTWKGKRPRQKLPGDKLP
ncbi:MAG TPA: hypothetical protein VFQ35_03695 [Polyangiaceae bacterium]|nr:hypothetical protein [Polyangiaceae bacterium]